MYYEIFSCSCFVGFFFSLPLCFLGNQTERLGIFFPANSRLIGLIYAVTFVYYYFLNDLYFAWDFRDFAYMLGIFSFERLVWGLNKDRNWFKYVLVMWLAVRGSISYIVTISL